MTDDSVILTEDEYLAHYGILRKSGRYPWGSGSTQNVRNKDFLQYFESMKEAGLSDAEAARGAGITTTQLRAARSLVKNQQKQANIAMAQRLKDKGYSNVAIGERMGINESSVRSLLAPGAADKSDKLTTTTDFLKQKVDEKGYIDIGTGVEYHVLDGVSRNQLDIAVAALKEQGYEVHSVQVDQLGTGGNQKTLVKVLAPPGTTYKDIVQNKDKITQVTAWSEDNGRSVLGVLPPISVNASRVEVVYKEQGGAERDGVIYVRPGAKDLSMGRNQYAQVRIAVNDTHYLKGMAVLKDDLPPGVDLQFHTNKSFSGSKLDAMKGLKDDADNPFGSIVRQQIETLPNGKEKVTSAINIVNDQGKWGEWNKSLSTQVVSKQSPKLAKTQLDMTFEKKKMQLDEISKLTNPAVRKKLLESYADDVDSSAVHLKAAALPRQRTQVILPINSLKENEIYAPNFKNGETVALIRYPHGGKFEIPELVVNNSNSEAKRHIGGGLKVDAVGIHHKVAERLSGADFDGDTVLVIPQRGANPIKTERPLEKLKGFDPQSAYPAYDGMKTIDGGTYNASTKKVEFAPGKRSSPRGKGTQMGLVSNLITDMTIKGANNDELARAVRHSMVVIDSEKHVLNHKQSSVDNGIPQLMKKYQGRSGGGSSTLISQAKARVDVPDYKPRSAKDGGPVDPLTGKRVYVPTNESYVNGAGKTIVKKKRSQKLVETDDARTLSSGTPIEEIYANHSNRLKAMANEARRRAVNTAPMPVSRSAKKVYSSEVDSLNAKLALALRNRPLERQAQIVANATVKQKTQSNPTMDKAELKKLKYQALDVARTRTGARKNQILITPSEWEAIQAGALSNTKLNDILDNADLDEVKKLATPRVNTVMTSVKQQRARQMLASGYPPSEIAEALGVPVSTLASSLEGSD